jgi:hypothetical protein
MGIAGDLIVHLKRYSKDLIENTFLKIEEPETPLDIPVKHHLALAASGPHTIGQFYADVRAQIVKQGNAIFTGDKNLQVAGFFSDSGEDIVVSDVTSALLAIETIVEQGEGTSKSPTDLQKHIAHYYRFQQLTKGMRIVEDPASPLQFSFEPSQPITIDDKNDVIQMVDDPPLVTYDPKDWRAEQLSKESDASCTKILKALHQGFNGNPAKIDDAVATMFEFKAIVGELLQQKLMAGSNRDGSQARASDTSPRGRELAGSRGNAPTSNTVPARRGPRAHKPSLSVSRHKKRAIDARALPTLQIDAQNCGPGRKYPHPFISNAAEAPLVLQRSCSVVPNVFEQDDQLTYHRHFLGDPQYETP